MKKDMPIHFDWKNDWELLFTRNNEVFVYKRYFNMDAEVFKPLRIDWVIKFYFWEAFTTFTMILMRPLWRLYYEHLRMKEGEELTLTGRQLVLRSIKRYKL